MLLKKVTKNLPKAKLMIVGMSASNTERVLPILKYLGLKNSVILVKRIPNEEMFLYYSASDIVILPSLFENFPVVLLEAMACGKPTVASRVGGIPEIIKNYTNGILVEPANSSQLAEAILYLLQKPAEHRRIAYNARKTAEKKFDWKVIGNEYFEEFHKLL